MKAKSLLPVLIVVLSFLVAGCASGFALQALPATIGMVGGSYVVDHAAQSVLRPYLPSYAFAPPPSTEERYHSSSGLNESKEMVQQPQKISSPPQQSEPAGSQSVAAVPKEECDAINRVFYTGCWGQK